MWKEVDEATYCYHKIRTGQTPTAGGKLCGGGVFGEYGKGRQSYSRWEKNHGKYRYFIWKD